MKFKHYFLLAIILFTQQSCFEIIEQVLLKNDGSGNFQLVINMSKSKTRINSMRKMKTVNGHPVPTQEEISEKVAAIEKIIAATPGLTAVNTKLDFTNYIATLTLNFSKITQVNAAVKNVAEKEKKGFKADRNYDYNAAANIFTRFNTFSLKEDYNKMSNADKEIFATANYTAIYKFENSVS
ncbi:MAG: hypothetical protein EOO20_29170, partial [Chryseobacterium sp.]